MTDTTTAEVVQLECGCEQLAAPDMHVRHADFEFGRGEKIMDELFGGDWRDNPTVRVLGFVRHPEGGVTVERFRVPYVIHGEGDEAHAVTYVEQLE